MPQSPASTFGVTEGSYSLEQHTARQAWYTIFLLCILYVISWIDRGILALLAQPVADALGLNDRELALILGPGFAAVYAVAGVMLGHFVDTRNRRIVVAVGIVIWSLATIASAFAPNFETMLLLRCGVALGEAVLMPAGISLIGDLFRTERRGLPVAVFTSIGSFMTIGTYAFGAAAISIAGLIAPSVGLATWQTTLVLVGLPGLALTVIFVMSATIPARGASDAQQAGDNVSIQATMAYLWQHVRFLGPLLSLTGLNCIAGLAAAIWMPTVLIREQGMTAAHAGYLVGLFGLPAGLLGNFFWQWVGTRLHRRDPEKGLLRTFLWPAFLAGPSFAAGLMSTEPMIQLAGFAGGIFLGTAFSVTTPLSIQAYIPARMRARFVSINFLIISIFGYGLGPVIAVEVGSLIAGEGHGLRIGLIATAIISWPLSFMTAWLIVRNAEARVAAQG